VPPCVSCRQMLCRPCLRVTVLIWHDATFRDGEYAMLVARRFFHATSACIGGANVFLCLLSNVSQKTHKGWQESSYLSQTRLRITPSTTLNPSAQSSPSSSSTSQSCLYSALSPSPTCWSTMVGPLFLGFKDLPFGAISSSAFKTARQVGEPVSASAYSRLNEEQGCVGNGAAFMNGRKLLVILCKQANQLLWPTSIQLLWFVAGFQWP
jgi:hypothetical protein